MSLYRRCLVEQHLWPDFKCVEHGCICIEASDTRIYQRTYSAFVASQGAKLN